MMKNIIEEELYKLKDDKQTLDFIDNKDCIYYNELDFAITILERILEKIRKTDIRYNRNNEIYRNVDVILYVGDKERIIFHDIDFEINENFCKTIAHTNGNDFIIIYSIKNINYLKIRPTGKLEELFESESDKNV